MQREAVSREGISLSLCSYGEGRPFVFQHGLGGDANQAADVFPLGIGWAGATLECRGHGQSGSGAPAGLSIASFAADLISVIEARGWAPLPIGGISMGAAIALRIAVLRPDLVSALVLARPAWLVDAAPRNVAPNKFVGELLRDHPIEEAVAEFERSPLADFLSAEAPDNLVALRGFFSRRPVDTVRELLLRIPDDGPGILREALAAVRVPTLVIGNSRDAVHPLALARELAGALPAAQFVEITSKSDDRERYRAEFRAALSNFLQGLAPRVAP